MFKNLYLMCGPAGSGKTTYIKEHAKPGTSAHISRDKVRFSMVKENEGYFSKEKEVYREFCNQIKSALGSPWIEEVFVDATHLTEGSRELLLRSLNCDETVHIIPVVIRPALEIILRQNSYRDGRERVPETVVKNMYKSFEHPNKDKRNYHDIIIVRDDG